MAIAPAVQLAALQARMTLIQGKITTQQGNLATNEANHALIMAALDQLNYAQKDCQSKIDTINTVLGNATNPDPIIP